MIQKNPYAAYNNSKIQTATPAELTLLLYEGAIKFTNIAIVAMAAAVAVMMLLIRKLLAPMELMKSFVREKIIGEANVKETKDESEEIRYLIKELEDRVIDTIHRTREESAAIQSKMSDTSDRIGDINGIRQKLDYLQDLGVDYLWITPFFRSPMNDNGYDIADYLAINPMFGTMEDVDALIKEAKEHNIQLMFDMVFNHTSTSHEWFQKALTGEGVFIEHCWYNIAEHQCTVQ